jgi:hypothetical protein
LATADAPFEFGSFRVLLRRGQLLADGAPVKHGTRAYDLLWSNLKPTARSSLKKLLSRVWPGGRQVDLLPSPQSLPELADQAAVAAVSVWSKSAPWS